MCIFFKKKTKSVLGNFPRRRVDCKCCKSVDLPWQKIVGTEKVVLIMRRQWGFNHPQAGVLPIMAYTGRLRPKGVPFSGLGHMKGLEFHSVEAYRGMGKSLFSSVKRPKRAKRRIYACEKVEKISSVLWFVHIFKTVHLRQLKGKQRSTLSMWKGVPFVNRRYTKGVPFLSKMVYKG